MKKLLTTTLLIIGLLLIASPVIISYADTQDTQEVQQIDMNSPATMLLTFDHYYTDKNGVDNIVLNYLFGQGVKVTFNFYWEDYSELVDCNFFYNVYHDVLIITDNENNVIWSDLDL